MTLTLPEWDILTGPRLTTAWVDVLDRRDQRLGRLEGVTYARVEQNQHRTIRGALTLTFDEVAQTIDWYRVRFQPWLAVNDLEPIPWGIFLPGSPRLRVQRDSRSWEVSCLDKTSILDQDVITAAYGIDTGENIVAAAAAMVASTGETRISATASPLTARTPMSWQAGESKLRIVNDLLDSVNYRALWADRAGWLRLEPYRRPQDRPPATPAPLARGENAIHSDNWSRDQDIAGVPNRVILTSPGTSDEEGLFAVAENRNPDSPFRYDPDGRGWVTWRPTVDIDAADQATLDALAARHLAESVAPAGVLSTTVAPFPLDPLDPIRFVDLHIDALTVVDAYDLDLLSGEDMRVTLREVIDV